MKYSKVLGISSAIIASFAFGIFFVNAQMTEQPAPDAKATVPTPATVDTANAATTRVAPTAAAIATTSNTKIFVTSISATGMDGQPIFGYTSQTSRIQQVSATDAAAAATTVKTITTTKKATDVQALFSATDTMSATRADISTNSTPSTTSSSATFNFTLSQEASGIECAVFPLSSNTNLSSNTEIMTFIQGLQAYKFKDLPTIPSGPVASCPSPQTFTGLTDGKYLFVVAPNSTVADSSFEYFAWQVGTPKANVCFANSREPLADSASFVTKAAYYITGLFSRNTVTPVNCGNDIFTMSYKMAIDRVEHRLDRVTFAVSQAEANGQRISGGTSDITKARELIGDARLAYGKLPTVQGVGDARQGPIIRSKLVEIQSILDGLEARLPR